MSKETASPRGRAWVTWSSLGLGATGLGQFVLLAALARILGPVDFGVVTAVLVVVGVGRVVHSSIGPALVQRDDLRPEHVGAANAIAVATAVAMTAAATLAAPSAAQFFRNDLVADVLRGMSWLYVCQALGVAPEAMLQRELRLRELAIAEALGVALGCLPFGIGMAAFGFGAHAMTGAFLAQAAVKCYALVWLCPTRPTFATSRKAIRDVARFSLGVFAAGLCNYAASQGDNVVVGRAMPASALGVYGRAYQLMAMPAMFLGEVTDRVAFPLLSRVQNDRAQLRVAYGRGVSLVACVMAPAAAACVALAPEIVRVVLGPGWDEVATTFAVLSCGLVFRTGYKLSDMLARATGTVYARAWRQAIFAALLLLGAWVGSGGGTVGVACGVVAALAVNYALMAWLSLATTGMRWPEFFALHLRGIALAALLGSSCWAAASALRAIGAPAVVVLSVSLLAAFAVFVVCARAAPRRVLGEDGVWLWRNVVAAR